jgi:hypothetical protein
MAGTRREKTMLDRRQWLTGSAALAGGLALGRLAEAASPADIALAEQRGRFLVTVGVNAGRGYRFVLDTGASAHFISEVLADQLKLPHVETRTVRDFRGAETAAVVRVNRLDVGGRAFSGASAITRSAEALEGHDGLVGYPILGPRARIDLAAGRLSLGAAQPEAAMPVPAEVSDRQTVLLGGLDGAEGRFVFDTGSQDCVVSPDYLERLRGTEAYRAAPKLMVADDRYRLRMTGFRPPELRFGDLVVRDAAVMFPDRDVSTEVFHGADALFGVSLIRRNPWIIDRQRGTLHAATA